MREHRMSYLSSLDMTISWVWLAEVLAEKLMQLGIYLKKKVQTYLNKHMKKKERERERERERES